MTPVFYTVAVLGVVGLYLLSLLAYKTSLKRFFDRFVFSHRTQLACTYLMLLSLLGVFLLSADQRWGQAVLTSLVVVFAFPRIFQWMVAPPDEITHYPTETVPETFPTIPAGIFRNKSGP